MKLEYSNDTDFLPDQERTAVLRELEIELQQAIYLFEHGKFPELNKQLESPEFITGELAFLAEKNDGNRLPEIIMELLKKFSTLVLDGQQQDWLSDKAKTMLEIVREEKAKLFE